MSRLSLSNIFRRNVLVILLLIELFTVFYLIDTLVNLMIIDEMYYKIIKYLIDFCPVAIVFMERADHLTRATCFIRNNSLKTRKLSNYNI